MSDPIRSVFVQWPLLLERGERLAADLLELSDLNTVELSNFYLDWGDQSGSRSDSTPLALPPTGAFGDLPVPVVDESTFAALVGAIEEVRAAGLRVLVNVTPLYFGFPAPSSLFCVDAGGRSARHAGTRGRMHAVRGTTFRSGKRTTETGFSQHPYPRPAAACGRSRG